MASNVADSQSIAHNASVTLLLNKLAEEKADKQTIVRKLENATINNQQLKSMSYRLQQELNTKKEIMLELQQRTKMTESIHVTVLEQAAVAKAELLAVKRRLNEISAEYEERVEDMEMVNTALQTENDRYKQMLAEQDDEEESDGECTEEMGGVWIDTEEPRSRSETPTADDDQFVAPDSEVEEDEEQEDEEDEEQEDGEPETEEDEEEDAVDEVKEQQTEEDEASSNEDNGEKEATEAITKAQQSGDVVVSKVHRKRSRSQTAEVSPSACKEPACKEPAKKKRKIYSVA